VHFGTATEIRAHRADTLTAAYERNPTRFHRPPQPPRLPTTVWINRPALEPVTVQKN
jgi:putative transposase